jgi:hypothetical protein
MMETINFPVKRRRVAGFRLPAFDTRYIRFARASTGPDSPAYNTMRRISCSGAEN